MLPRMRTDRRREARRVHPQGVREFWSVSVREEWPSARGKFSLNLTRKAPGCAMNARLHWFGGHGERRPQISADTSNQFERANERHHGRGNTIINITLSVS